MKKASLRGVVALVAVAGVPAFGQGLVEYTLTFDSTWSEQTHPAGFPTNAPHMSSLIGAVHTADVWFWREGTIASDGLEAVAERGSRTIMTGEIQAAVDAGQAYEVVLRGGINPSPDVLTTSFLATGDFPVATFVSMIAPSPDWFVGVDSLRLFENGRWVESVTVALDPWDSGTDSGARHQNRDIDTVPREPVRNLFFEFPFSGDGPLGTFTFAFSRNIGCPLDTAAPYGSLDVFDIMSFFAGVAAGTDGSDLVRDGVFDVFDILAFFESFSAGC